LSLGEVWWLGLGLGVRVGGFVAERMVSGADFILGQESKGFAGCGVLVVGYWVSRELLGFELFSFIGIGSVEALPMPVPSSAMDRACMLR
jgi:hypothetical protein